VAVRGTLEAMVVEVMRQTFTRPRRTAAP